MWAVFGQHIIENELKTKHVESTLVACLDPSSILGGSTKHLVMFYLQGVIFFNSNTVNKGIGLTKTSKKTA